MKTLTYRLLDDRFSSVTTKAFDIWSKAMKGIVEFVPATTLSDILVISGHIDLVKNPGKVGWHRKDAHGGHTIIMGDHVKWNISSFARLYGAGEDALNCLVHEIGHVLELPHATEKDFIMHPTIPGGMRLPMLSKKEVKAYRNFVIDNNVFN